MPVSLGRGAPESGEPGSYVGLSLREALARARSEGLAVEVSGSGYVVRQDPPPGRSPDPGAPLRLVFGPTGEPAS
jgi:hypothetical protein